MCLEEPSGCIKVPLEESPVALVSVPARTDTLMSALFLNCLVCWSRLHGVLGRDASFVATRGSFSKSCALQFWQAEVLVFRPLLFETQFTSWSADPHPMNYVFEYVSGRPAHMIGPTAMNVLLQALTLVTSAQHRNHCPNSLHLQARRQCECVFGEKGEKKSCASSRIEAEANQTGGNAR
jgi:hypothetical protein